MPLFARHLAVAGQSRVLSRRFPFFILTLLYRSTTLLPAEYRRILELIQLVAIDNTLAPVLCTQRTVTRTQHPNGFGRNILVAKRHVVLLDIDDIDHKIFSFTKHSTSSRWNSSEISQTVPIEIPRDGDSFTLALTRRRRELRKW